MTTASALLPTPVSRTRYLLIAAVAAIAQMLMMIPGYSEDGELQVGEWLIVLLISLVVSAALFTFVVPQGGAVSALVLAIVAPGIGAGLLGGHHVAVRRCCRGDLVALTSRWLLHRHVHRTASGVSSLQ